MKKLLFLFAVLLTSVGAWAQTSQKYYKPGPRTLTLEAGKEYFISVATYYGGACTNLLYNNNGTLAKSNLLPNVITFESSYIFTVEEVGDGYLAYIKNSSDKYIQADNLASTETKTGVYVIPYFTGKAVCCGGDVDACDANGNKILYNDITAETPIVTVQKNADYTNEDNRNGWRYIDGLSAGVNWCTAFAFYEAEEVESPIELTTDANNPKWYTIKNVRSEKYANYASDNGKMQLQPYYGEGGKFYFTGEKNADGTLFTVKIHNAKTTNLCAGISSWDENGIDWYVQLSENTDKPGYAISSQNDLTNDNYSWNNEAGKGKQIATYKGNDIGSTWEFSSIDSDADLRTMPQMSTVDAPVLYYIRNARQHNTYANYVAAGAVLTQVTTPGPGSYWYFVAASESAPEGWVACKIYNAANATSLKFPDGTFGDQVYYIKKHEWNGHVGFAIKRSTGTNWDGWNDKDGSTIVDYDADDAGSIWWIEEAPKTADQLKSEAATAKANALNTIAVYEEADYYAYADDAIAAAKATINAVNTDNLAEAVSAMLSTTFSQALTTLDATEKSGAPVAGDYIQLKNRGEKKYLTGGAEKATDTDNKGLASTVWVVEAIDDEDNVRLKNVSTGKYVGPFGEKQESPMVADAAQAAKLTWINQEAVYALFKNVDNETDKAYGHVNGGNLTGWTATAERSQWRVSKVDLDAATLTNLVQLSEDKVYTLRSKRAFLFYRSESPTVCSSTGTAVGSVVYDRNESNQQFMFKEKDGNYYLYSVGAGKYVKKDGTYTETIDEAHALSFADKSANSPEYPWQLALDGNELNSQNGGQNAAGIMFSNYDTADDGNCYKIEVGNVYALHVLGEGVANATVTINGKAYKNGYVVEKGNEELQKSDITPSVIEGKTTVINIDGDNIYVSYIDETTQFYTIRGGHGGYMSLAEAYVDADKNLCLDVKSRIKDKQGLWTFVEQEGGGYKIYNYSTGWSKAVGMTTDGSGARARMLAPDAAHTAFDGNINFDGTTSHIKLKGSDHNYWNRNGDYRYLSLWNSAAATNNDVGSMFFITAVDFNNFVDVAKPVIPEVREELDPAKIQGVTSFAPENDNTLWYRTSAMAAGVSNPWMEYALPLGNGELGCMVYGNVLKEEIQFNEKTLWSGPANALNIGAGNRTYMNFGSLFIKNLDDLTNGVTDYVRYLDIEEGVAGVKFTANGTKHTRKYFSSAPDQVIAGQYKIEEGEGKLNLRFTLEAETEIDADYIIYKEGMASFTGYMESVNYAARVHVKVKDGNITTTDEGIVVTEATEVTFFLKGATNFDGSMDAIDSYFTSDTPAQVNASVKSAIEKAAEKDFATIETAHREDFKKLTGSMTFSLGLTAPEMDTKQLVDNYFPNNGDGTSIANDHLFLEQLYFHYGRYLAISSNRKPIAAPNNLQGIWNNRASGSPWNSDIHTNINIQMNYWPTEITNLSDLHKPFVNYIIRGAQTEGWKNVSKQYNNNGPGWGILTETSLYGAMSNFMTNYLVANVWYTSHLWQHYRYTLDEDFLKKAFPAMWGAAEFWMHRLIKDRVANDGTWVAPDEYSAEQDNHSSEDATAHAQQMVSYLFQNIIDAIEILGEENVGLTPEQIAKIRKYNNEIDKGLHTEIYDGAWGATFNGVKTGDVLLREWKYSPYSVGEQGHRHLSHLMALFPMDQITPESPYFTPAVNALKQRGDANTGWSMSWKVNLWARAQDGDHAHLIIKNALKHSTSYGTYSGAGGIYYNLFDSHSPFQIDGNFGVCSGMAEMLMQSAHGYINILPALPTVWEKTGTVTGMKAMGNFTVDFNWENGKAQKVTIVSHKGAPLKVRCKRGAMDIAKAKITVNGVEVDATVENGIATIPCKQAETVVIDFTTEKSVGYIVSAATGTFNKSWASEWAFTTSKLTPAALKLTTTNNAGNMQGNGNEMYLYSGKDVFECTYRLSVSFPYQIAGYSFTYVDKGSTHDKTITIGEEVYNVTTEEQTIVVNDLATTSTEFTLKGSNEKVTFTNFKVNIKSALPFVYADSYENITQWYYIQMNPTDASNGQKYAKYSANNELGCADKTITPTDGSTKIYAWAFVGNPIDGFKVYNRSLGGDVAVHSTGSGPLTMQAGGTAFMVDASSNAGDGYFCFKTPSNNYWNLSSNKVQHWSKDGGCTILLTPVDEDPDLAAIKLAALATVAGKVNTLGTTLGHYTYTAGGKKLYTLDAVRIALRDADTDAEITALLESYELNMPQNGQFFRIRGISGKYIDASSIYNNAQATTGQMSMKSAEECNYAGTIFYLDSKGQLLNYAKGTYIKQTSEIGTVGDTNKGVWTFEESPRPGKAKYALSSTTTGSAGAHLHDSGNCANRCDRNCGENHDFTLELVTELPLTIHSSGKSTYSAPEDLEIPDGVTVYYAKRNDGETIRMAPLFDVIPANTGVVVAGAGETTVNFPITTGVTQLENNLLKPVVEAKAVTPESGNSVFVMATKNDVTGFYPLSTTNNVIGGHKSYLEIRATSAARLSIVWDDTETGIFETEGGEQNTEIYDLTGRRLDKPVKGINIIGGKLVIK